MIMNDLPGLHDECILRMPSLVSFKSRPAVSYLQLLSQVDQFAQPDFELRLMEGLGQAGVDAISQAFYSGFHIGLGRQQYDRYVAGPFILFYGAAQFVAVYFRHHHIADDVLPGLANTLASVPGE